MYKNLYSPSSSRGFKTFIITGRQNRFEFFFSESEVLIQNINKTLLHEYKINKILDTFLTKTQVKFLKNKKEFGYN